MAFLGNGTNGVKGRWRQGEREEGAGTWQKRGTLEGLFFPPPLPPSTELHRDLYVMRIDPGRGGWVGIDHGE